MVAARSIKWLLVFVAPALAQAGTVVKTAVIGGMMMTGLWPALAARFEASTGIKVEVVASGPRELIAPVFRAGQADLITMHSGDITTDLAADGFGVNMRPWTRNELVIVGPSDDPASICGMTNGVEALRKIAARKAPFIDVADIGSREVYHHLWKALGERPHGDWVIKDESVDPRSILQFAEARHAYAIVGRMPVVFGRLQPSPGMAIMVQGDPAMRRPYVVMELNPEKFPAANAEGARKLSDYLLSPETQGFLAEFGTHVDGDRPFFYPVRPPAGSGPADDR